MTIVGAIQKVLSESGRALTHKEIYECIISNRYYEFGAKDPLSIVRNKVRKHCVGV
ncbi:winged helix-turn-helix domain-containing protein, partial [Pseudomonas syringae]